MQKERNSFKNVVDCNYDTVLQEGNVCSVPIEKMSPCHNRPYQYDEGHPCIYLKLNKVNVLYEFCPKVSQNIPLILLKIFLTFSKNLNRFHYFFLLIFCEFYEA